MPNIKSLEKSKLWTRDYILIFIGTFFIFCAFQILMPTLPMFAKNLGADKAFIGLINGIFTISAVIFRPFIGRELDRRGRKGIYILGLSIFFLAVLGYIWVPTLILLLTTRFIHGIGWAGASTAAGTIVADIIPPSRLGEGMGYYGVASTLAMAVAPAVALTLLVKYDYTLIFIISLILTAGAITVGSMIRLKSHKKQEKERKNIKAALFDKRAFKVSLIMFFMTLSYGGIVTFLPLYAEEQGILNIGPFFTVYAISLMLTRPIAGKYYDRKGPNRIIILGMLAMAIANFMLNHSGTLLLFIICGTLFGLGFGSVQPTLLALAIQGVEPQRRGAINGMVFSAFDLGIGIGALGFGLIANNLGYATMYLIASLTPLIGLGLFFLYPEKTISSN